MPNSKPLHTQGPWEVEECGCCVKTSGHCRYMSDYCGEHFSAEETGANAHLIAAAPEMYEVLDVVRPYLLSDAIVELIDETLAKARGES